MGRAARVTLDLGVGQPDYPAPEHIKQAGRQAIADNYTRYTPQAGFDDLRDADVGHQLAVQSDRQRLRPPDPARFG